MKKKIFSILILTVIILSGIIIPKIYADNTEIVSIPNTNVKVGEQAKVHLNLENISEYTLSKIALTTDIYIEPILDTANTNLTKDDIAYDTQKKELTIKNISNGINTICVNYTIPEYIANGTKIKLTVAVFGYKDKEEDVKEQCRKTYEITVIGNETDKQNNNGSNDENGSNGNMLDIDKGSGDNQSGIGSSNLRK